MASVIFDPWIHITKPDPLARMRLFCFPYAGGGASLYRSWQNKLQPGVEICAVQLPGRENRIMDPLFTQLPPLITALAQALRPYLNKPFVFFGHSMGALLSFELARELRRQRAQTPLHLFASSHRAPQLPDPDPIIHQLPEAEFLEKLHQMHGTPRHVLENDEIMQMMLPIIRADFTLCETYVYRQEPPFAFPISAFGGSQDPDISLEHMKAWKTQTHAPFKLTMFQGDHFYLQGHKDALLHAISQDLTNLLNDNEK